ncbi:response regulator receiver domain [Arsukibacterium sp.]|uniref:response regulator receiver domain n=1 Tax=Arsukibacterium sp. TaxID=1977258 RepID=UPI00299F1E8E|nr:response regulator receiver domain [Arsukibacterium sp.]MDX1537297.1 response regulator receiver domain [Arsukibacterium sp.]
MREGTFFESSKAIVCDFLNNVIAVDDNLIFEVKPENVAEEDFDIPEDSDSGLGYRDTKKNDKQAAPVAHPLNYQDLSLAFTDYGINCCAFKPDINKFGTIEVAAERIQKSTKRADITILDWSMDDQFGKKSGSLAKLSIEKILQADIAMHGRLRLIVVYTGETDPEEITRNIFKEVETLDNSSILSGQQINFSGRNLQLCQINVIGKNYEAIALRDEVVALFTELTIGLLSNATLSAIGELRDKTHHILHAFNKHLDPAYVSHVLGLLSSPKVREYADEVAFDYAAELISEEFKSIIQIAPKIKSNLRKERIKEWLDHINTAKEPDFFEIIVGHKSGKVDSGKVKSFLDATTSKQIKKLLQDEPVIILDEEYPNNFFEDNRIQVNLKNGREDSHDNLSIIECKRRDSFSISIHPYEPNIKLGSIIKGFDDSYYICLQPLCDSVRLSGDSSFLFLKVDKSKNGGKFSHVIQDSEGSAVRLLTRYSSINIQKFTLKYNAQSRTIRAVKNGNNKHIIEYKKEDGTYGDLIWVGELKSNIAQSISNNVAASISRIGLDTNEWLRLSAVAKIER